MAKNHQKLGLSDNPNHNPAASDNAAGRTYPWTGMAVNNTPIQIYLSEAGVCLAANYNTPTNAAVVTYQTADHFNREMANIEAIASVHGFSDPLIFSDHEPETSDEDTTK